MHYILYGLDKPDQGHARAANREAHLAWAAANRDTLVMGGPLLTDDGGTMTGSLALFEAASAGPAKAFAAGDPYGKAGLFQSVAIHPWYRAVPGDDYPGAGGADLPERYVIYGRDRDGAAELRGAVMEAHVAHVREHLPIIHYAGPMLADDEETPIGPLFIVAASGRAGAEAFLAADPFSKAGLLDSADVRRWKRTV